MYKNENKFNSFKNITTTHISNNQRETKFLIYFQKAKRSIPGLNAKTFEHLGRSESGVCHYLFASVLHALDAA